MVPVHTISTAFVPVFWSRSGAACPRDQGRRHGSGRLPRVESMTVRLFAGAKAETHSRATTTPFYDTTIVLAAL